MGLNTVASDIYYKGEYKKIVDRFVWNASVYDSDSGLYDCCYKEVCKEIEKLDRVARRNGDLTPGLRVWALQTVMQHYMSSRDVVR
ncbi:hypothetical protein AB3329_01735 [Streptococcus sp. H31]|uniref:hypothetical protein n=1 Tax=Streptococcus huangxiaojuni TaxID=3237239 RepID=UPI0034A585B2